MTRDGLIVERTRERANEISKAIPWETPGPQYWLMSDAGEDYCHPCVMVARGREFELGPLIAEGEHWYQRDDWQDAFLDGIDGGRDIESDNACHCARCGVILSYILTDYGAENEAICWLDSPVASIGPVDAYELDRLTLNLFDGMARRRLLVIAAAVGQTYRTFKAQHP